MTTQEAAKLLNITPYKFTKIVHELRIKPKIIANRNRRWLLTDAEIGKVRLYLQEEKHFKEAIERLK